MDEFGLLRAMCLWVKANGPFWGFSVRHPFLSILEWLDWDVHWGYDLAFDPSLDSSSGRTSSLESCICCYLVSFVFILIPLHLVIPFILGIAWKDKAAAMRDRPREERRVVGHPLPAFGRDWEGRCVTHKANDSRRFTFPLSRIISLSFP